MSSPNPDDELLSILLTNLRNAAATFGEGTPPHNTIRITIEEHLQAMRASGIKTNLTAARSGETKPTISKGRDTVVRSEPLTSISFNDLVFRPKPQNR